jgi:hypothetical protein
MKGKNKPKKEKKKPKQDKKKSKPELFPGLLKHFADFNPRNDK